MKIYIVLAYHTEVPGCFVKAFKSKAAAMKERIKLRKEHGAKNVEFDEFEAILED